MADEERAEEPSHSSRQQRSQCTDPVKGVLFKDLESGSGPSFRRGESGGAFKGSLDQKAALVSSKVGEGQVRHC
eukprot:COSAG05_NODE_17_length_35518_cov_34.728084_33_plen_74_part_00